MRASSAGLRRRAKGCIFMASMTTVPPLGGSLIERPPPSRPTTFEELARLPDESLDVATGAALIARDAYARLDLTRLSKCLDDMAAPLIARGIAALPVAEQAQAISSHMYEGL